MAALQIIKETEKFALIEIIDPDWASNPERFHVVEIDRDVGLVSSATPEDAERPQCCAFSVTGVKNVSTPHSRGIAESLFQDKVKEEKAK